ncbi:hypothetical protein C7999DRAFT_40857 [Corynascus novoguineensis]|uniref:Antifreeze protein n=1 Tax=Corynascus novoguineensis TaxID=1126955 RepID=A0AAN7CV81_9PEZI|nr:hypothetical protein C7999DRAFT_40857 [Corynascus novoguineensis]
MLPQVVVLVGLASAALGQVTLQPSTVRTGRPVLPTSTVTVTATVTESYIHEQTKTITAIETKTETETQTETETETKTETSTVTSISTQPCVTCPTLTSTATACKSCLVPQCTKTSVVTKPRECATLPTATVSFPCEDKDACNKIGCTTVYDIKTAA